jgi:hypothetical protein
MGCRWCLLAASTQSVYLQQLQLQTLQPRPEGFPVHQMELQTCVLQKRQRNWIILPHFQEVDFNENNEFSVAIAAGGFGSIIRLHKPR